MKFEKMNKVLAAVQTVPVPLYGKEGAKKKSPYCFRVASEVQKQIKTFLSKVLHGKIPYASVVTFMDITLFGSGKKGILLTGDAIYNSKGQGVLYDDIINMYPKNKTSQILVIVDNNGVGYEFETGSMDSVRYTMDIIRAIKKALEQPVEKPDVKEEKTAKETQPAPPQQPAPVPEEEQDDIKAIIAARKREKDAREAEKQAAQPQLTDEEKYNKAKEFYYSKDYDNAAELFGPLAAKGHRGARYFCGQMYFFGRGVGVDYGKAFHYTQLAAQQKDNLACMFLGAMYDAGKGTDRNLEKAVYWLEKSIEYGNTSADVTELLAMVKEDLAAEKGETVSPAPAETPEPAEITVQEEKPAPETKRPAAPAQQAETETQQEEPEADKPEEEKEYDFGGDPLEIYLNDDLLDEFLARADIDTKIAFMNHPAVVAQIERETKEIELLRREKNEKLEEAFDRYREGDHQQAYELFVESAEMGSAQGRYQAGLMNFSGKGTEKNYEQALYWLKKAYNDNIFDAADPIAMIYGQQGGEFFDMEKFKYWAYEAQLMGTASGDDLVDLYITMEEDMAADGKWLELGKKAYDEGNYKEAYDHYSFIANTNSEACYRRGMMLMQGIGVDCNEKYAIMDLHNAASKGHAGAQEALDEWSRLGAETDEFKTEIEKCTSQFSFNAKVKEVENTQNKWLAYRVARQYEESTIRGVKNIALAKEWYEKSAALGNGFAWYSLADLYLQSGGRKHTSEFLDFMEQALRGGVSAAAREMAAIYRDESSDFFDVIKARDVLSRGSRLTDADCMYEEGKLYLEYYDELGQDKETAVLIANMQFARAADRGHKEARKKLGR